jgi:hypothetical protein
MLDTMWVALLSGSFGLLTAGTVLKITQSFDREKRRSEEERWRQERESEERRWSEDRADQQRRWMTERLLERKIDALTKLQAELVDCHFAMNLHLNVPPKTWNEFWNRVAVKEEAYLRAKVIADVYLTRDQKAVMSRALGSFRRASHAIALSTPRADGTAGQPPINDPWGCFRESYDAAVECLEGLLNPDLVTIQTARGAGTRGDQTDTDTDTDTDTR